VSFGVAIEFIAMASEGRAQNARDSFAGRIFFVPLIKRSRGYSHLDCDYLLQAYYSLACILHHLTADQDHRPVVAAVRRDITSGAVPAQRCFLQLHSAAEFGYDCVVRVSSCSRRVHKHSNGSLSVLQN
jgi:hypothetical protein